MTSWRDDLTLAQARLADLEAAELKMLKGETVTKVMSDGDALEYGSSRVNPDVITRAIQECRLVISRLSGATRRGGAIVPYFG